MLIRQLTPRRWAKISDGVTTGLFNGSSYGSKVTAVDGAIHSDMTPYTVMPCQGTNGVVVGKAVAGVTPDGITLQGLNAYEAADQSSGKAWAWEKGSVEYLDLGNGALVVDGVVGKANISYVKGKPIHKDIRGSHILSITSNGQAQTIPSSGVLEIPGVARLEQNAVSTSKTGISVIALRSTLLDQTALGTVINLGCAKAKFSRAF